jgi:hypothetical protein
LTEIFLWNKLKMFHNIFWNQGARFEPGMVMEVAMNRNQAMTTPSGCVSYMLGQASAMFGILLSLMWGFVFVLALAHLEYAQAHSVGMAGSGIEAIRLPIEPALFGLALGGLGLLIARWKGYTTPLPVLVGLVSNCLPLAMAVALQVLRVSF